MKQNITYSQNVYEYNNLGMYGTSSIYGISVDQLKVKRNRLIEKYRRQGKVELLVFGNIKETIEKHHDETDDIFQLTDTITNKRVSPELKNKAEKLKRTQDRKLKLKRIQKKGKFKSHQRFH